MRFHGSKMALALFLAACAHPSGVATDTAVARVNVLVVYHPGPAWIQGKPVGEQPLKEHGRYLISLYKKGVLRFAGPLTGDLGGGAAVFAVATEAEGRAVVAADPAVTAGVMVPEIYPWRLLDWQSFIKR
jgi:uncharacterized protein YciI